MTNSATPASSPAPAARTVVIGVNLSPASDDAADVGARSARRLGGGVVLAHAAPVGLHEDTSHGAILRRALGDQVTGLGPHGVDVDVVVEDDHVPALLARVANESSCELLIIAAGADVGAITRDVVRHAHVPVLVLRDSARIDAWLRGERPLKAVLAATFDDAIAPLRAMAKRLRAVGPVDIVVEHTSFLPEEHRRLGAAPPTNLIDIDPAVSLFVSSELHELFARLPGEGTLAVHVHAGLGRADAHIASVAAEDEADVVVIGSHQRFGLDRLVFGSVDDGVLRTAPTNILVVPVR